jgi:hypothetical protein
MKSKPRLVSKPSASVAALKQKLALAKIHAEEMKAAARAAKAGFKQVRKAYRQAKKAAKQARKAVKALAQEIKAQTPPKIRRSSSRRAAGTKQPAKRTSPKTGAASASTNRVSLGVTDGPVETVVAAAPNSPVPSA